ncbi:CAP domain [Dillenia turbinata]|uniref:CAP domain n=1 Tax=Dillenia turbinata TaxID=194707 RepID=A0AAN8UUS9_9MAGN
MNWTRVSFALIFVLGLALVQSALAQSSPQDFLNPHNEARAAVGVGPLVWDDTVAAFALKYATERKDCAMMHSGGPYGENIATGGGDFDGEMASKMWIGEKPNYDYSSDSCVGGECRHYTQVVWRNSVRIGCARVRCDNGGVFITCNYDPKGNIGGRPY